MLRDSDTDGLDMLDVVPDLPLGHRHGLLGGVNVLAQHHGGHVLMLVCVTGAGGDDQVEHGGDVLDTGHQARLVPEAAGARPGPHCRLHLLRSRGAGNLA